MSEDAPVNTGAGSWPDPYAAGVTARRTRTKLHLWATRDPGRCFGRWRFARNEAVLTGATSVTVTRYRYRGGSIATPWTPKPPAAPSGRRQGKARGAPGAVRVARRVRRGDRGKRPVVTPEPRPRSYPIFRLITQVASWLRLSRREEAWLTAEILLLRHQLAVLQRRQPRRPNLNWADRALIATPLGVIPKARRQGLRLLVTPDTILRTRLLTLRDLAGWLLQGRVI